MRTLHEGYLNNSNNGQGIVISVLGGITEAVSGSGTLLHRAPSGEECMDKVMLTLSSIHPESVHVIFKIGESLLNGVDVVSGTTFMVSNMIFSNGIELQAFASVPDVITVFGQVWSEKVISD